MPPRKRAASTPKPDIEEAAEPAVEGGSEETAAGLAVAEPENLDASGADAEAKPERSDIQTGEEPCGDCFPGGWAAQAAVVGALGCEHGTWQRSPVD